MGGGGTSPPCLTLATALGFFSFLKRSALTRLRSKTQLLRVQTSVLPVAAYFIIIIRSKTLDALVVNEEQQSSLLKVTLGLDQLDWIRAYAERVISMLSKLTVFSHMGARVCVLKCFHFREWFSKRLLVSI